MDALEGLKDVTESDDFEHHLKLAVQSFGFESYILATAYRPWKSDLFDRKIMINWPQAWHAQYEREKLGQYDAVHQGFKHLRRTFRWADLPLKTDEARRIMTIAADDFRLRQGICIPIHGLEGYEAGFSIGGADVDATDEALFAIELMSVFAFNKYKQTQPEIRYALTPRQREVLHWIAAGKTAWEIGTILRISADTANKITKSAMQRLGVHTRAHAVAEAVRRREVNL